MKGGVDALLEKKKRAVEFRKQHTRERTELKPVTQPAPEINKKLLRDCGRVGGGELGGSGGEKE
jgi:hypothetical protein